MSQNPKTNSRRSADHEFTAGQIVATQGALDSLEASRQSPLEFLARHLRRDWGIVSAEDAHLNDQALISGARLISVYETRSGERLWVITDAADDCGQRPSTTLLLPQEY